MNHDGHFVDPTAKLNVPLRLLQGCVPSAQQANMPDCELPQRIYIGPFVSIGKGVRLGENVIVDAYCAIDPAAAIGANTLITYRATIGGNAVIGKDCVIGGFIPENSVIGDRCRIFGNLVHSHRDATMSWDHHEIPEVSPRVCDDTFVGFGALIIGDVTLGPNAYICAGATVTSSVPPFHIARGINVIVPFSSWKGPLASSPFFIQPSERAPR